jgi:WD40 repeat protein
MALRAADMGVNVTASTEMAAAGRILARTNDEPVVTLDAHGRRAQAVAFTSDGSYLLSCGQDGCIRLWRPPGFRAVGVLAGHAKSVNTLALSGDGTHLASGSSDHTVRLWSLPDRRVIRTFERQFEAAFSPDGSQLATLSAFDGMTLWRAATGDMLATLPAPEARLYCLAYAPDGQSLLVGGTSAIHRVNLRDPLDVLSLKAHRTAIAALCASPDGALMASVGVEGMLRLWSTETWREVASLPMRSKGATQLAFEPKGTMIAVSVDHAVLLYRVADGALQERIEVPVKGVYGVAFSPDGRYLACAAADGKVRIWATRLAKRDAPFAQGKSAK